MPRPGSVRIRPHPVFGLEHLRPWFGSALGAATGASLAVDLDDDLLDAPLSFTEDGAQSTQIPEWAVLKGDCSFSYSARTVLEAMADDPPASVDRIARAARMSKRSVQRALTEEGTRFRKLLDESRRGRALWALSV